jgi:hypothetical protein
MDSLAAVLDHSETGANSGLWWYNVGLLQSANHRNGEAKESFKKVLA